MRINMSFGVDVEELPAFNKFLTSLEAARKARYEAEDAVIEGLVEDRRAEANAIGNGQGNAQASAVEQIESSAQTSPKAVETVVFGEEDVASATLALANKKGVGAASAVLSQFSVVRARDLKPEQRAEYITAAKAAEAAA